MSFKVLILLLLLLSSIGHAQLGGGGIIGTRPVTPAIPEWQRFRVTKIANGVAGCANANGCWQVNSGTPVAAIAGLTQALVLFQLPAGGFVHGARLKSRVACSGATTITVSLGVTGNVTFFVSSLYDLIAAVADTNFSTTLAAGAAGSTTNAAINVVAGLTTTVQNIDAIANGCSFDAWVHWASLPL